MSEKTATEVRLEILEDAKADHSRRIGAIERTIWWAIGAVAGVAGLAGSIMSGVLKRMVT